VWVAWSIVAFADSPLTSVDWAAAYADLPAVVAARAQGVQGALPALLGELPADQKLAVVSALGWGKPEQALKIAQGMAKKRGVPVEGLKLEHLSATDRAVLAYAAALGDYFDLSPVRPGSRGVLGVEPPALARSATEQRPDDFALAMVASLIDAQDKMDASWCEVWRTWDGTLARFPEAKRNVRASAVAAATDYLKLYADECPKSPGHGPPPAAGAPPTDPQLDEVYDLVRFRDKLITASQGGLVVFDLSGRVESWRQSYICGSMVVVHDEVWAACYKEVLRFDGARWTQVRKDETAGEGGAFQVLYGAQGAYLLHEGELSQIGKAGALTKVASVGDAYDVTVDGTGQRWTIAFMDHLMGSHPYKLGSEAYPGRDPRSFVIGPDGGLWVTDFESGYFTYDRPRDRFVPFAAGPKTRGSDVAVDKERDRVWLLHYTEGVTVVTGSNVHHQPLADLQYMRALELDRDGSVWVAGWNGIVRVQASGEGFAVTRFDAVR
jgi:hypothetical protein